MIFLPPEYTAFRAFLWAIRFSLLIAILAGAVVFFAAINLATAKTGIDKPELPARLPQKADVKPVCRVVVGRGLYFLKMPDGSVAPMVVLMSIRTRC